jgi:hypothetical protein
MNAVSLVLLAFGVASDGCVLSGTSMCINSRTSQSEP